MRLLHISDTHFGTEQTPVVEAVVALAAACAPDLVLLSGDITQRAQPAQFAAARAFVERLGAPVLAIPGNHDIPLYELWLRVADPYGRYRAAFGTQLEPEHVSPQLLLLCLNTTRTWRHKNGEVSMAQVDRVARRLAAADAAQLRIVVVHQPLAVRREQDVPDLLRGRIEAQQAWSAAGADLVLGGHIHYPYITEVPGLRRPMWVVQAGTAVSSRVRSSAPNSVNLLRWGDAAAMGACIVERWDFAAGDRRFERVDATTIRPQRS